MKANLFRKNLDSALDLVAPAISTRSTLPCLANVHMAFGSGYLRLTATDLELCIQATIEAEVPEAGDITLPAKTLREIVSNLTAEQMTLTGTDQTSAELRCGRSRYELRGLPAEEYPEAPEVAGTHRFVIPQAALADAIRYVRAAVSSDDTRPILTAACLDVRDGAARLVATDTHRLAIHPLAVTDMGSDGAEDAAARWTWAALLLGRALGEVLKALDAKAPAPCVFRCDANQASFTLPHVILTTRLIEGQFPRFDKVIPTTITKRLVVEREEFLTAAKRAAFIARENSGRLVIACSASGMTARLTAQAGDLGSAQEEIMAEYEGEDMEIVLNVAYLLDALTVAPGDRVALEMTAPLSPVLLRPVEEGLECSTTIMPMQLT